MAAVRHVLTLDYVASILGEHPELIDAIAANDDNLSYWLDHHHQCRPGRL